MLGHVCRGGGSGRDWLALKNGTSVLGDGSPNGAGNNVTPLGSDGGRDGRIHIATRPAPNHCRGGRAAFAPSELSRPPSRNVSDRNLGVRTYSAAVMRPAEFGPASVPVLRVRGKRTSYECTST